jgi:hypothetical protein
VLLREGVTMQKAIEETDYGIDDLSRYARWSIDDKSVREALYGLYADEIFDLDGIGRRAETFGFFSAMTGTVDALPTRLRAYERIDASRVTDVFREDILRTPRIVAFVEPHLSAEPGGKLESVQ